MKKFIKKISVICVVAFAMSMIFSSVPSVAIPATIQGSKTENAVIATVNVGASNNEIQYKYDSEIGDYLGPESFSLKSNGGFFLLDTAKKEVLSFGSDGKLDSNISYGNMSVAKIATGPKNDLYMLDPANGVIGAVYGVIGAVYQSNKIETYSVKDLRIEPLVDFGVTKSGLPYVVLDDQPGGTTYLFNVANNTATKSSTFNGRLAPDGNVYKTMLIKDAECDVGHACAISIFDQSGNVKKQLTIKSNHWLEGAKYLGEADGLLFIQTHEFENGANNNIYFEDTVREYDDNGNLITISVLPKEYKYIENDSILNGSSLYHLDTGETSVNLEKLGFIPAASFVSELDSITSPTQDAITTSKSTSQVTPMSTLPYVKRSLIQATAVSFNTWTWHCSQANYTNTDPNWIRPRYITGYDRDYQCVPYMWGGWDSLSGFQTKQGSGVTTGNIGDYVSNCTGVDCSGYVQRCWGLNDQKYSTTMLDGSNISYSISASALKFGDAWNRSDHIMVYHQRDGSGNYVLYEATELNSYDRVAHTVRSASSVEGTYHSIRRCNVTEDV